VTAEFGEPVEYNSILLALGSAIFTERKFPDSLQKSCSYIPVLVDQTEDNSIALAVYSASQRP
jgi:hypothetical protein